jgi:hypothetical protein
MITGSTAWTTALNSEWKKAQYMFFIPSKQTALCSFMPFLGGGSLDTSVITLGNWTDLATSGAGSPILTTAAGRFQPWMVGFSIVISAGTNFTAGTYLITKWNSLQSVTLQSSPTPGGAGSAGVATINVTLLPILNIPTGSSQAIDELNGHSSIATLNLTAIDPSGALKTLSADSTALNQIAVLTMGFGGLDISEYVAIHTGRISELGRTSEGLMTITVNDLLCNLVNNVFLNGGPPFFTQFTAAARLSLASQSGDRRQVVISGWDTSGNGISEVVTLNGATEVLSVNTYLYILGVTAVAPTGWTALTTSGAGSKVLVDSLSTGLFTAAMVGSYITISFGTNFVIGAYKIDTYTNANSITLHDSPTPSGAGSNGNGVIGSAQAAMGSMLYTVTMKQGSGGTVIGHIRPGLTTGTGTLTTPPPPLKPNAFLDNGAPISKDNPRYLCGHPLDILMVVMQNELGVGQAFPPSLVVNTGGGSGVGQAGFGINRNWTFYDGTSNLINPNPYYDVPGVIALRDGQFAGMRMEFVLTSSQDGKSWCEDEILRPLGLFWVTGAGGELRLKSMKHPASPTSVAISDHQIMGIPDIARWPVVNMIEVTVPNADPSKSSDQIGLTFVQQHSIDKYQNRNVHDFTSEGLRLAFGACAQLSVLSNRLFNRHAFATPEYTFRTYLKNFVMELGEFFVLTHPKMLDLETGLVGIANVLCEITDRKPDYANGTVTFKVIDTRLISVGNGVFEIALLSDAIPDYGSASSGEKAQYMFVSDDTGDYSTGAVANEIH